MNHASKKKLVDQARAQGILGFTAVGLTRNTSARVRKMGAKATTSSCTS